MTTATATANDGHYGIIARDILYPANVTFGYICLNVSVGIWNRINTRERVINYSLNLPVYLSICLSVPVPRENDGPVAICYTSLQLSPFELSTVSAYSRRSRLAELDAVYKSNEPNRGDRTELR